MNEGQVSFCRLYLWVWFYLVLFVFFYENKILEHVQD